MEEDSIERLNQISEITWQRHFDDRLGRSAEELQRVKSVTQKSLPIKEKLIADKREHILQHSEGAANRYDPDK